MRRRRALGSISLRACGTSFDSPRRFFVGLEYRTPARPARRAPGRMSSPLSSGASSVTRPSSGAESSVTAKNLPSDFAGFEQRLRRSEPHLSRLAWVLTSAARSRPRQTSSGSMSALRPSGGQSQPGQAPDRTATTLASVTIGASASAISIACRVGVMDERLAVQLRIEPEVSPPRPAQLGRFLVASGRRVGRVRKRIGANQLIDQSSQPHIAV